MVFSKSCSFFLALKGFSEQLTWAAFGFEQLCKILLVLLDHRKHFKWFISQLWFITGRDAPGAKQVDSFVWDFFLYEPDSTFSLFLEYWMGGVGVFWSWILQLPLSAFFRSSLGLPSLDFLVPVPQTEHAGKQPLLKTVPWMFFLWISVFP